MPFAFDGKVLQLKDRQDVHNYVADPEEERRENFLSSSVVIAIIMELILLGSSASMGSILLTFISYQPACSMSGQVIWRSEIVGPMCHGRTPKPPFFSLVCRQKTITQLPVLICLRLLVKVVSCLLPLAIVAGWLVAW